MAKDGIWFSSAARRSRWDPWLCVPESLQVCFYRSDYSKDSLKICGEKVKKIVILCSYQFRLVAVEATDAG